MLVYRILSVVFMTSLPSHQSPLRCGERNCGSSGTFEILEPIMLLVLKSPILYQNSHNDNIPMYASRHIRRYSRDLSTTSREGRFLFKSGAKKLQNLFLWSSLLANSAATGSLSTSNSFNLFGKTINSALSIAYGNRGFIPGAIPPLVPPVLPPFPILPIIPPVTTTANSETSPVIIPITRFGPIPSISASVRNENPRITPETSQTDETNQRQLLDEYLELEKRNRKLLSQYNNLIKEQQRITINQNEQLKQFLQAHNLMVDQFNDKIYFNVQRSYEI
ncbi:uncharacterized protein LOC110827550 [Zootermopsis nevadensis]|uniref:uncharacterized protein LOC110827550 n=1 Tax=Zootermopsis nevadensis TaxID=136037 RepID=UPI000B8E576E|nr:uncharacterized protein LOC110827550 [Zootermopsis nevadensis]